MVGARARVLSFIGKLGNSPDDRASCARLSSRRIVSLSAQPLRLRLPVIADPQVSDRGGNKGLNAERTRRGFLKVMGVGGVCLALLGLRGWLAAPRIRATASRVRPGQAWT